MSPVVIIHLRVGVSSQSVEPVNFMKGLGLNVCSECLSNLFFKEECWNYTRSSNASGFIRTNRPNPQNLILYSSVAPLFLKILKLSE